MDSYYISAPRTLKVPVYNAIGFIVYQHAKQSTKGTGNLLNTVCWSGRQDSNLRPPVPKTGVLANWTTSRLKFAEAFGLEPKHRFLQRLLVVFRTTALTQLGLYLHLTSPEPRHSNLHHWWLVTHLLHWCFSRSSWRYGTFVRKEGLEPSPHCWDQLLRLACLPFHHFRIISGYILPTPSMLCFDLIEPLSSPCSILSRNLYQVLFHPIWNVGWILYATLLCGEAGIRTLGALNTPNGFQDHRNRPLCHLSIICWDR